MSVEDQEQLSSYCSENNEEQMEPCPCWDSWTGERDLTQFYEMTLRAILEAHQQTLNSILAHSVGGGAIQATTCRIPARCPTGFTGRYTVRRGDSMFTIAQRCGVTLQALINANPHIANPNVINPCDVLCVPPRCADTPGITCRIPARCPTGFTGRYTVRAGDSMFRIAQRCGVTLQALINANPHITNPNVINPCDVLCVPPRCADAPGITCRVPASCPTGFQGRYTVRSGDSMFTIAQRCGVTLQALINANPHITNPNVINPCDVLCVPLQCATRLASEEVEVELES